MSNKSTSIVATMGIDIGKNSFHVVGLDERGAIANAFCGRLDIYHFAVSRRCQSFNQ